MKSKNSRLDSIKMIISSKEIGSQEELLQELAKEGFQLTQATPPRDLKQKKNTKTKKSKNQQHLIFFKKQ